MCDRIFMSKTGMLFLLCSALIFSSSYSMSQSQEDRKQPSPKEIKELIWKLSPLQKKFEETSWSRNHPDEREQTFDKYISKTARGTNPKINTIYVQQIGGLSDTQGKVVDSVLEFLEVFFCSQVKRFEPLGLDSIPQTAKRTHPEWGDKQILSTYILDKVLLPRKPKDAIAVLGLTASDLWPEKGWNFVFGQASLYERVGVWSVYRYGNPDADEESYHRFFLRTLKVALHETGHMYGIEHCISFKCGMNGSNSLPETDDSPIVFCSECSAKIWYKTGADPAEWSLELAKLAVNCKLKDEAEYWNKSAKLLGK